MNANLNQFLFLFFCIVTQKTLLSDRTKGIQLLLPKIKISRKSPVFAVTFFSLQPPVSVLSFISGFLLRKQLQ